VIGTDLENVGYVYQVARLADAQKLKTFCLSLIAENYQRAKDTFFAELSPEVKEEIVTFCKK
jgi:hypothetical protein